MNPEAFPERMTSPRGFCARSSSRTRSSSAITSAERILAEEPSLSNNSQTMLSRSVCSFQCRKLSPISITAPRPASRRPSPRRCRSRPCRGCLSRASAYATGEERRVHPPQPHLRRIEPRPLRIVDAADGPEIVALHRFLGGEHEPRRAVGHLRAVACRDVAVLAVEEGLELREVLDRRVLAHAVVVFVERTLPVIDRR